MGQSTTQISQHEIDQATEKSKSYIPFSPEVLNKIEAIKNRYPEGKHKSALIPVLHIAQGIADNWLSVPIMDYVASLLNITPIEVYEVATFYTMYNLKPVGKVLLEVCHTGPCSVRGAEDIIHHIENRIGCKVGQTSPDGMFTLKTVECLGACGYAPMMQIGDYYYEHLTPEKTDVLLDELRKNAQNGTLHLMRPNSMQS